MKILHLLNHTQRANGHVCAAVDLSCTQAALGHEVHVCSAGGDFDAIFAAHGVRHFALRQERKPHILIKAFAGLRRLIGRMKPDIVHAHMVQSALLGFCLRPFMDFGLVTTVHNSFDKQARLMGTGDRVIAVSEAVRQLMIKRGIPAQRLRTVLNGTVGSPRFPSPAPQPLNLKRPAIVFVGGLHPRKGADYLIKAFGIVSAAEPAAHLYLIGAGPLENQYRSLASATASSNITFCGHDDDPRRYLLGGDIFILPSLADPAPLVISEARQAGIAIVASNVDGIPELLDQGRAGDLVPPKLPGALAEAMLKLIRNPDYLSKMKERALDNIAHLSVERVARQTVDVYRELAGARDEGV
jgi:glycosyltransferase involved in cell wall biosynthesis